MELNGIEYIELNMANYDEDCVSQLNAWAIEAYGKIAQLEAEDKQLRKQISQIQDAMLAGGITVGKCITCGCEVACDALTFQFTNNVHCRNCAK